MSRTSYTTVSGHFLDMDSPCMKLWQKAKKFGIWNPNEIDFSQDAVDWNNMTHDEREMTMRSLVQFLAGEESVTIDILPLIMVMAQEGRLEEEMFLTSFLWEEAKHVDGFIRFFREVVQREEDLTEYIQPSYDIIFKDMLPNAMNALLKDPSPENQARASVTYNMIVEGVLAETGYFGFFQTLEKFDIMPGLRKFVGKLKQDESRHIAYGIYLLSRLIAEHGDSVWEAIQDQMNKLMIPAMGLVQESYEGFDPIPFDQDPQVYNAYAMDQFQKRFARLERARNQSLEEVNALALAE
ncbi:MAG: R2-like ligand-binding oxidase [Bacteroidia bacterium]|nr:R2-like ligand-binding oxidase [Bacteroidia bacterium]